MKRFLLLLLLPVIAFGIGSTNKIIKTPQNIELNPGAGKDVRLNYLTTNSILFSGSNGALSQDNTNFTFTDGTDTLDLTGILNVDNLKLDGNVISSTDTNGNITLTPDGSGEARVSYLTQNSVLFSGANGKVDQDNTNLKWDDTNDILQIGSGSADTSSILETFSTTKGTRPCPSMTTAQRDAISSPASGLCVYNTDDQQLNVYDSTSWGAVGGATGGGQYKNFIDLDAADETDATGWSDNSGNNASFDGGGTIQGTLTRITSSLIDTTDTANFQFTQAGGSLNDYFYFTAFSVDEGRDVGFKFHYTYNGSDDDLELQIKCSTSGVILTDADPILLEAATSSTVFTGSIFVPSGCGDLKAGFSVAALNSGKIFKWNRWNFNNNPFVYKNLIETASVVGAGNGGTVITANVTNVDFTEVSDTDAAWDGTTYTVQSSDSVIILKGSILLTTAPTIGVELYKGGVLYRRIGVQEGTANSHFAFVSKEGEFTAGDTLTLRLTAGATLSNSTTSHFININESRESEYVVTPGKAGTETYIGNTHAGYGSTNTMIPYLTNEVVNTVSDYGTVANDSTNGWSFTASKNVIVDITYSKGSAVGGSAGIGISLNSSQLTTVVGNINAADRLGVEYNSVVTGEDFSHMVSASVELSAGDVLRPHSDGNTPAQAAWSAITLTVRPKEVTFLAAMPNPVQSPGMGTSSTILLVSASVDASEVVTEDDSSFISSCTNADPSVCTLTANFFSADPKCWAEPTSAGLIADVTADTTASVTIDRTDASTPFKLFCHGYR